MSRNPHYSMRALARDLDLSASYFCQVLRGKRNLAESKAHEIAERCGWSLEKTRIFLALVRISKATSARSQSAILRELDPKPKTEFEFSLKSDFPSNPHRLAQNLSREFKILFSREARKRGEPFRNQPIEVRVTVVFADCKRDRSPQIDEECRDALL